MTEPDHVSGPAPNARRGFALALGAAASFGLGIPLIQRASEGVGSFFAAALLYAGAALSCGFSLAWTTPRARGEAPLGRPQLPLLVGIAVLGAALSPAALIWGLARTSGLSAALLLNAEGAFTVLLARLLESERLGGRLVLAVTLIFAGSALVALGEVSGGPGTGGIVGVLAVAAATLGWATDSTLASRLSGFDPRAVVAAKSAIGAVLSIALALTLGESGPVLLAAAALVAIGSVSYGASLMLYLSAQRILGAGRAGAVFSVGPFFGALLALALGDRTGSWIVAPAALLLVSGVGLQIAERHAHAHRHAGLAHDHRHGHDDGHHDHLHDPMPASPHSHVHAHDERVHAHPHTDDAHHRHRH
ncbi:MAG: DMT family transporter [Deltaproteobacteria bacterium]|nr:DMT family transporter [Deltaproteobacteria bacterium]